MSFRQRVLTACLDDVSMGRRGQALRVVEVGCMFQAGEGLSTLTIAEALAAHDGGGEAVSIDLDVSHVTACEQMFRERGRGGLLDHVKFQAGRSSAELPAVLGRWPSVDLFFIDGGANPEICLWEFEQSVSALRAGGLIVMDDAHELKPTSAYPGQRIFGKATLVIPFLLLDDYVNRSAPRAKDAVSPSGLVEALRSSHILPGLDGGFHLAEDGGHRMLIYGPEDALGRVINVLSTRVGDGAVGGAPRASALKRLRWYGSALLRRGL